MFVLSAIMFPCADARRKQIIEEHFDSISGEEYWIPRYNIAPTQPVPIIRQHPREPYRELSVVRWGLVPSWAKDLSGSAQMINARSETAATKPAFRDALASRRCLVPADGFYEWKRTGKAKQPYCFEVNDGQAFAFAGIWERWKDPSGQWIKSCSILTTTPNAVTSAVPRPDASHPRSEQLRFVARSRDEECRGSVRNVEALRRPEGAIQSRQQSRQPCCERRRDMLDASGSRRGSTAAVVFCEDQ